MSTKPTTLAKTTKKLEQLNKIETELDVRRREAMQVYRPMHAKQQYIHECTASEILVYGGKRSGKTLGTTAEFTRRVTGFNIIGLNGKPIAHHWPVPNKFDTRLYWMIGWSVDHLAQSMYGYLFLPQGGGTGMRVIRDLDTGMWRAWNERNPSDEARFMESEPAGPMIPEWMIEKIDWQSPTQNYFREVILRNGAKIRNYPSSARNPKMGDKVSGIWIDEDIQVASHLEEWQDRLTDAHGGGGWFLWSVWPKMGNAALVDLMDRVEECAGEEDPQIECVNLVMTDNQFITDEAKQKSLGRMGSEEARKRRNEGSMQMDHLLMYDFVAQVHAITKIEDKSADEVISTIGPNRFSALRAIYTLNGGSWPRNWTRYVSIDPSHTRTAALFAVVPPQEVVIDEKRNIRATLGNCVIVENEIVRQRCNAFDLAKAIKEALVGRMAYAFIMDRRMGVQTQAGADINVYQRYSDAFQQAGLTSILTKHTFIPGCDNPPRRYGDVRKLLSGDGWPFLFFDAGGSPATRKEFTTYKKKTQVIYGVETIMDEPANPRK
ncbi:MAG: hypothetical protein KDD44_09475, partial [Bdellovibrionales bacterium]|nr:hypothetical protein [Bdellovibrionales bacterium]